VTLLQSGEFDLILAGGYDPISEYVYAGFNSLRLVANGPLRPFSRGREGMKLAEGYAIVALERESTSRARARQPIALIVGLGESADAHHLTQPHPQGDGAARAMSEALRCADLQPSDIGLIAAHATGTPDNDAAEFAAMSRVFGPGLSQVPVVAFKSHLGHTLGAAGAVELILSAMALGEQVVPPCANVCADDVEFSGLNLSLGEAKSAKVSATLNTSLGFGGANTCVVLAAAQGPGAGATLRRREVFVTGIGIVLPGAIGNEAFVARVKDPGAALEQDCGLIPEAEFAHLLNARRVRRMSDYVKYSLAATALAFADAGIIDVPGFANSCAAILGTTHGSATYCCDYYGQIVREGFAAANPMLFAEGVPNAAAAHLSLMMSLKGACQTIIGTRTAGLDALRLSAARIAQGQWDRAVVSAGEEFCETVNRAYAHCGLRHPDGFFTGCGAITFVLESAESVTGRNGSARGRVFGGASAAPSEGRWAEGYAHILARLGTPPVMVGSANRTWIDRIESAGLRGHGQLPNLHNRFGETFSVSPLIEMAAVMLGGRQERDVGVLCTDFTGVISGARISRE
jgi:3-oxoacyl-[acyl-carrier-protein] synthase II